VSGRHSIVSLARANNYTPAVSVPAVKPERDSETGRFTTCPVCGKFMYLAAPTPCLGCLDWSWRVIAELGRKR